MGVEVTSAHPVPALQKNETRDSREFGVPLTPDYLLEFLLPQGPGTKSSCPFLMQGVRMGETSTNIAMLNMNDALKVRVKDGCDVEDPCASSPCPQHSRCQDSWDSYSCVCDKGGSPSVHPPFS